MKSKQVALSDEELEKFLVDLGIGDSSQLSRSSAPISSPIVEKSYPQITVGRPKKLARGLHFILPFVGLLLFFGGFYLGIAFASTLSLTKTVLNETHTISQKLQTLDEKLSQLIPPENPEMSPLEIIEPLQEKKEIPLPKSIA